MAEGNQAFANFGWSVAGAGDINKDGYADIIVGAYLYDDGEGNEGRAYVYLGGSGGLSNMPVWTAEGNQASAYFANSVASAGDVNNDGYADVIVGAELFSSGQQDEGRAFVFHGDSTGPSVAPDWTAEINQTGASFGSSVACAGDVNGDGYSDVIVGAKLYTNGEFEEGAVFVFFGSALGLSTTPDWTFESDSTGANLGGSVAGAGDVNMDGYSDVIVGAEFYSNGESEEGRAFLFLGDSTGLSVTPDWTAEIDQTSAGFGGSVASAGDVDMDGYADVIVGAATYNGTETNEGQAFVYLGGSTGLAAAPAWSVGTGQAFGNFGRSVASAGDVNKDGYSDVIVGAELFDNPEPNEGGAFVYLGGAAGLSMTPAWSTENDQALSWLGRAVAGAGDVNGNGYDDVIIGIPHFANGHTAEGQGMVFDGFSDIVPVFVQSFDARWTGNAVELSWTLGDVTSELDFDIYRKTQPSGGFVEIRNANVTGHDNHFVFVDVSAKVGTMYTYRVGIIEDGKVVASFEASFRTPPVPFTLYQNHPNPFGPTTRIEFSLTEAGVVMLQVYDVSGRLVRNLVSRSFPAGIYHEDWDGRDAHGKAVASGTYLIRLSKGGRTQTRKAVLVR